MTETPTETTAEQSRMPLGERYGGSDFDPETPVIGAVSQSDAGFSIIRAGRMIAPGLGGGWHRELLIVLTPDEREWLIGMLVEHRKSTAAAEPVTRALDDPAVQRSVLDDNRRGAEGLLEHYMRQVYEAAGLTWNGDNSIEMEGLVGCLMSAARATAREEALRALAEHRESAPHVHADGSSY